jgi:hypothetical protein
MVVRFAMRTYYTRSAVHTTRRHEPAPKAAPPARRPLLLHDDKEREYVAGAERALERAKSQGWTVISLKNDWATVFAD